MKTKFFAYNPQNDSAIDSAAALFDDAGNLVEADGLTISEIEADA